MLVVVNGQVAEDPTYFLKKFSLFIVICWSVQDDVDDNWTDVRLVHNNLLDELV